MAKITAFIFSTPEGAMQMLDQVRELVKTQSVFLQDGVHISWQQGENKPRITQLVDLTAGGTLSSSFWGMLFGLIFFVPHLGMAFGSSLGALAGKFSAYGISSSFTQYVKEKVIEGTSAVLLMGSCAEVDKMQKIVKERGWNIEIFSITLSAEQEKQMRQDFGIESLSMKSV